MGLRILHYVPASFKSDKNLFTIFDSKTETMTNQKPNQKQKRSAIQDHRRIIRCLLDTFGKDGLINMIQEISTDTGASDAAGPSPEASGEAAGSLSNSDQNNAVSLQRTKTGRAARYNKIPLKTRAKKGIKDFYCLICREGGTVLSCGRKNDMKRHFQRRHEPNEQWFCPVCEKCFPCSNSFKGHCKDSKPHEDARLIAAQCKDTLCAQLVFACGYPNCTGTFEARCDKEADATLGAFLRHLDKHYDERLDYADWSYSHRLRNLLCQRSMQGAWEKLGPTGIHQSMEWDFEKTNALRKCLETRHFVNPEQIVKYVLALGSSNGTPGPGWTEAEPFVLPSLRTCVLAVNGHVTPFGMPQQTLHGATFSQQQQQHSANLQAAMVADYSFVSPLPTLSRLPPETVAPGTVVTRNGDGSIPQSIPSSAYSTPRTPLMDIMPHLLHIAGSPQDHVFMGAAGYPDTSADPHMYPVMARQNMYQNGEEGMSSDTFPVLDPNILNSDYIDTLFTSGFGDEV